MIPNAFPTNSNVMDPNMTLEFRLVDSYLMGLYFKKRRAEFTKAQALLPLLLSSILVFEDDVIMFKGQFDNNSKCRRRYLKYAQFIITYQMPNL